MRSLIFAFCVAFATNAIADHVYQSTDDKGSQPRPNTPLSGGGQSFDYFYLVRQWPATFCNDHSCTHSPPKQFTFTIHGMWPQRSDGTWPEFCDPSYSFSLLRVVDLLPRLARYWPSWAGPNRGFWAHEWERHGTCAQGVVRGEHAFFAAVLGLHRTLRIEDALSDAGIGPSSDDTYDGRALHKALKEGLGTYHHIFCDMHGNLAEIWSCIGLDLKPFDCSVQSPATLGSRPEAASGIAGPAVAVGPGGPQPNNACGMRVRIPPLDTSRRHGGGEGALSGGAARDAAAAVLLAACAAALVVARARRVAVARRRGGGGEAAGDLGRPLVE